MTPHYTTHTTPHYTHHTTLHTPHYTHHTTLRTPHHTTHTTPHYTHHTTLHTPHYTHHATLRLMTPHCTTSQHTTHSAMYFKTYSRGWDTSLLLQQESGGGNWRGNLNRTLCPFRCVGMYNCTRWVLCCYPIPYHQKVWNIPLLCQYSLL